VPRKLDTCMFCLPDPCTCDGPAPKKKVTKSKPKSVQNVELPPPSTGPGAPDLKAAMKAAMTDLPQTGVERPQENQVGMVRTKVSVDPELRTCLNVLYPILHEDDIKFYSSVLDTPDARAERWRIRHGS
jgi:hypothetical protein